MLALSVAAGCSTDSKVVTVRQIDMGMLASNVPQDGDNQYVIHQQRKTVGRFPCSMAVMRVTSELSENLEDGADPQLVLDVPPTIKAVPWTELFDNVPVVKNVKVMGRPSVPFEQVSVTELVRAARAQHARLLFVYGQSDLPANLVRMVGAMYDTETQELLATVRAQVEPTPGLPTPRDRVKQDKRHEDPECLTAEKFQALVLRCAYELYQQDTPATTTQPNPWDRPGVRPMISPWTDWRTEPQHYQQVQPQYQQR